MKQIVLLSLVCTLASTHAIAEGIYVGVKLGQANYDYSKVTNNDQSAVGFLAGFNINPNATVEIEYNNLGGFDNSTSNITGTAFSLSGIGSISLNTHFSLFGKLGLASTTLTDRAKPGFVRGDISHASTGLNIGLGAQYNINSAVGVRAGLDNFKFGNSNSNTGRARMIYVGALFHY